MTIHVHSTDVKDTVTVHRFESCPVRHHYSDGANGYVCCHPLNNREVLECDGEIPKECPLIRAPLHIKLGKGITDALDSSDDIGGDPTEGPVPV